MSRRPALFLLALTAALGLSGPLASAGFVSMGAALVRPDPSCASNTAGRAVCAARGLQNSFLVDRYDGASWSGWKTLAGVITSSPSCVKPGGVLSMMAAAPP